MPLLPFLATILVGCESSDRYEIVGNSPNDLTSEGKTVYLYVDAESPLDSTVVHDGKFSFKGKIPKGEAAFMARLFIPPNYLLPVVIEEGNIIAEMKDYAARGTPLNNALFQFEKRIDSIEEAHFNQLRKIAALPCSSAYAIEAIDSLYLSMKEGRTVIAKATLREHPNDVIGIRAMLAMIRNVNSITQEEFSELVAPLGTVIKESEAVHQLLDLRNNEVKTSKGLYYTDFSGTNGEGHPVKLSEYVHNGRYTLIHFWASWCAPCLEQKRALVLLKEKYHDKPLDFVGVLLQDDPPGMQHVLEEFCIDWPQIVDTNDEARRRYNISLIPEVILLDPYGFIIERHLPDDLLAKRLDELFKTKKNSRVARDKTAHKPR